MQDSSIIDIVGRSVGHSEPTNYNDYNDYNVHRDSDLDLDLDWERFSELVT